MPGRYLPPPCRFSVADIDALRAALAPLALDEAPSLPPAVARYARYYRLDIDDVPHWVGTLPSGDYTVGVNAWRPRAPRGTSIVVHGFGDHIGTAYLLIRFLLGEDQAVVGLDLPGHGLSSGARAEVDDFREYAEALGEVVALCQRSPRLPGPIAVVASSTGCAAVYEYLATGGAGIARSILCGPLVRSSGWGASRAGHLVLGRVIRHLPRLLDHRASSDEEYKRWLREHDLLKAPSVPIRWFEALLRWNERVGGYAPLAADVTVLQGDADQIVDWRYNVPFLGEKLPGLRLHTIRGGRHDLFKEVAPIQAQALDVVRAALG